MPGSFEDERSIYPNSDTQLLKQLPAQDQDVIKAGWNWLDSGQFTDFLRILDLVVAEKKHGHFNGAFNSRIGTFGQQQPYCCLTRPLWFDSTRSLPEKELKGLSEHDVLAALSVYDKRLFSQPLLRFNLQSTSLRQIKAKTWLYYYHCKWQQGFACKCRVGKTNCSGVIKVFYQALS